MRIGDTVYFENRFGESCQGTVTTITEDDSGRATSLWLTSVVNLDTNTFARDTWVHSWTTSYPSYAGGYRIQYVES